MSIYKLDSELIHKVEQEMMSEGAGLPTGFLELDYCLGGLQKGNLYVVGGRADMGKTAFALNVARYVTMYQGKAVLYVSPGDSVHQMVTKLLLLDSGVDLQKISSGTYGEEEKEKVKAFAENWEKCKFFIDTPAELSIEKLSKNLLEMAKTREPELLVVDYLQLLTCEKEVQSRQEEVAAICVELKKLARKLDIPILVLSQLSRAVEQRPDHRPMLSDLRDSGAIEQYADAVLLLYRDEYYFRDTEKLGIAEVIVGKNKMGAMGRCELVFLPKYLRFCNTQRI